MLVAEYLRFVGELRGVELDGPGSALDDAVQATGIPEVFYRPIGELSKGYKQRLGLAAATLHRPDFLILDEPTEGLDPNQRQEIRRLIREVGKEHTVILSTHVLPEVEETCRRIIVIHEGKIVADGSTEDLMAQARDTGTKRTIVIEVKGDDVAGEVVKLSNVDEVTSESQAEGRTRLTLAVGSGPDPRPEIFRLAKQKDWVLWELHEETASLQDLFSQLTR
ncbi:MAG: AAA family ATPase, partial [Gemmatimonadales bacterium]|jgi:ABC-2 type transport system ATP-binding protein